MVHLRIIIIQQTDMKTSVKTVSYTHLDVYKRQGHTRTAGIYKLRFHDGRQRDAVRIGCGGIRVRIAEVAQKVDTPHGVSVDGDGRQPMKPEQSGKYRQHKPQGICQIVLDYLHLI